MAQYFPTYKAKEDKKYQEIGRKLSKEEWREIEKFVEELEFENGDRIVMDNCSMIPEVYLGNVRERNEEGEEITKAVHLFVYENETGEVTL